MPDLENKVNESTAKCFYNLAFPLDGTRSSVTVVLNTSGKDIHERGLKEPQANVKSDGTSVFGVKEYLWVG